MITEKRKQTCKRYYDRNKEHYRDYYTQNKDHLYDLKLQREYNITLQQYNELLESQERKCKICKRDVTLFKKRLAIDHNHLCCSAKRRSCGKCIRGLLCEDCNRALGMFKDNEEVILNALHYITGK